MASPAKVLRGKNTTRTAAATQRLLAEVSRLVSYRYALPETFDGLLLHLRRALDVDIVALALPDESRNLMQTVLFALWADTSRSAVRTSLQRQPLWQSLVDPGNHRCERCSQ